MPAPVMAVFFSERLGEKDRSRQLSGIAVTLREAILAAIDFGAKAHRADVIYQCGSGATDKELRAAASRCAELVPKPNSVQQEKSR